jgi:N-sulfoglucosamine sulfohydrolase
MRVNYAIPIMKSIKTLIILSLFIANTQADETKLTDTRPNILFCIADDWGWPHAQSYGDKVVKTPTFSRIAKQGMLFEHAYISAPSCTPSRNAILTGKYHWQLGQGVNLWSEFPAEHATYPRILEKNGYFIGSYRKAFGPGKDLPKPVAGDKFKSPAEFFKAHPKDKPFCFWFGASDPHRGYEKGSGVKSGMKLEDVKVPGSLPDVKEVRSDICDYYFEVQRFDREVGQVLDLLESQGKLSNTIVIMTGDHGYPFPRGKSNLYDLGARVPLAIMWGDKIKPQTFKDFVSLVDIAPTILDFTNIPAPQLMSGRSLKQALVESLTASANRKNVICGKERHTPCQIEALHGFPMRSIRNHDYLYIHNFKPERAPAGVGEPRRWRHYGDIDNGPTKSFIMENKDNPKYKKYYEYCMGQRPAEELYDNRKDPDQLNNLATDPNYAATKETLKKELFKQLKATGDLRLVGRGHEYEKIPYKYYPSSKKNKK